MLHKHYLHIVLYVLFGKSQWTNPDRCPGNLPHGIRELRVQKRAFDLLLAGMKLSFDRQTGEI